MDTKLYYKIISQYVLPFVVLSRQSWTILILYNLEFYLHQDNDKKHTARINQKLLTDLAIIWVKIYNLIV